MIRPPHRRVLRNGALTIACVLLCGCGLAAWYASTRPVRLLLTRDAAATPADGSYHHAFHLRSARGGQLPMERIVISGLPARLVARSGSIVDVEVQAPGQPGERRLRIEGDRLLSATVTLRFLPDSSDRFRDGTPEFLRLHTEADRAAFRGWSTALADAASSLPRERVPPEIDDCAALLRWCYRNALHAHDETWQSSLPFAAPPPLPSVRQYAWPETPLGAALFRVREGAYAATDAADGTFAQFADARTLMQHNTFLVGRDLRAALPGDLLFYRQLEQNSPYHSMVLTGPAAQWAVYHTGPIGGGAGEMRRVLVQDLVHHPDRRWRPVAANESFLGVYRWNILRQER